MSRVGEKIKDARLKSGLSQKALAKKLGVSDKFVNEVETGRRVAQESFIERAGKLLNVDFNDISMVVTDEDLMEERKAQKLDVKETKSKSKVQARILGETSEVWTDAFSSVLKTVKGIVADFNPNRNGRVYPRELWEKVINSEYTKEMMASKMLLGEADHPFDDRVEISIKEVSHAINKLWIEGDKVMAELDILNTTNGQKVATLIDSGSKIGVSSRGAGSVLSDGRVDPSDYQFFTFDIVCRPSVQAARITESEKINAKPLTESEIANVIKSYRNINKKLENTKEDITYRYITEGEEKSISSSIISKLIKESEEL